MVNKIDDTIANKCTDTKLLELGLVYGDLLSFREVFSNKVLKESLTSSKILTYEERADVLKERLKQSHTGRIDSRSRPVTVKATYNVSFGLKCYEKKKYTLKLNKGFSGDFDRGTSYNIMHNECRTYFKIPSKCETFLALYNGTKIEHSFVSLEHFALKQKDKKKSLQFYLYYPDSYSKLQFKSLLDNISSESSESIDDFDIPCQSDDASNIDKAPTMLPFNPFQSTNSSSSFYKICSHCFMYIHRRCMY